MVDRLNRIGESDPIPENNSTQVQDLLMRLRGHFGNVTPFDLNNEGTVIFDFSAGNEDLHKIDLTDPQQFDRYVFDTLDRNGAKVGIGKYNEDRTIYKSGLFVDEQEPRTVHLGIDLFAKDGTPVYAPLNGEVHSYNDNNAVGDYGPTIILTHATRTNIFYTLYGHLNRESLKGLRKGKQFKRGDEIARMGNIEVNGNWPAHLHFEIITDMMGKQGDFPGVTSLAEREKFLKICPDPNLILGIRGL